MGASLRVVITSDLLRWIIDERAIRPHR